MFRICIWRTTSFWEVKAECEYCQDVGVGLKLTDEADAIHLALDVALRNLRKCKHKEDYGLSTHREALNARHYVL